MMGETHSSRVLEDTCNAKFDKYDMHGQDLQAHQARWISL